MSSIFTLAKLAVTSANPTDYLLRFGGQGALTPGGSLFLGTQMLYGGSLYAQGNSFVQVSNDSLFTVTLTSVPEPVALVLLIPLAGLILSHRRRR